MHRLLLRREQGEDVVVEESEIVQRTGEPGARNTVERELIDDIEGRGYKLTAAVTA